MEKSDKEKTGIYHGSGTIPSKKGEPSNKIVETIMHNSLKPEPKSLKDFIGDIVWWALIAFSVFSSIYYYFAH